MSSQDYSPLGSEPQAEPFPPPLHRRNRAPVLPVALVVLIGVALVLLVPYLARQIAYSITRGEQQARADVALAELEKFPKDANRFPLVANIIEPSVVGIETTTLASARLADVFLAPELRAVSQGSGVIVDAAGYIVTNAHVVDGATPGGVTVKLSDGRTLRHVPVIGVDAPTDLAVLKIDAGGLSTARLGDSDQLQVGDQVLAVGNPYGLARTVTAGIVSAKNRRLGIENVGYEDFLQTDAAVNPGNSGGPLVNMDAEVVGINSAIIGRTYQGISFAIPSNLVKKVYELLKTTGIARGWIGVAVQDLNQRLAEKFGLSSTRGALVANVQADSPAAEAGIQPGDVIVRWDDHTIDSSNDLRIAVAKTKPGTKAAVVLYREGKKRELTVTVASRAN